MLFLIRAMYWQTSKDVWYCKKLGVSFAQCTIEWNFIDNVVYCNILRSMKAAFLEIEKAMFTVATAVRMLTIITRGP